MACSLLPTEYSVMKLLSGLLGRDVTTREGPPAAFTVASPGTVGVYRTGDRIAGLCCCDLPLANRAGAALSMIPPDVAEAGTEQGTIEETLLANLHEVLNIGSQWFERSGEVRVTLEDVHVGFDSIPDAASTLLANPTARLDLDVSIPGYGDGKLTLLV